MSSKHSYKNSQAYFSNASNDQQTMQIECNLIRHQRCNRTSNFMVSVLVANWSKLNKYESRWHTDLSEIWQQNCFLQANECNQWFRQTVHFTDQNIGCLSSRWNLLREMFIKLQSYSKLTISHSHVTNITVQRGKCHK